MPVGQTSFDPTINYYEVLNVPYTATRTEIARAYRSLMRHAHPDRFPNELDRRKAEERAKLLNAAYTVLTRPDIRREYDQVIKQRAVNDVLFQRYTGNQTPGSPSPEYYRPPQPVISADLRRAQRRANRSAFIQFIVFVALFVAALLIILVVGSLIGELLDAVFA